MFVSRGHQSQQRATQAGHCAIYQQQYRISFASAICLCTCLFCFSNWLFYDHFVFLHRMLWNLLCSQVQEEEARPGRALWQEEKEWRQESFRYHCYRKAWNGCCYFRDNWRNDGSSSNARIARPTLASYANVARYGPAWNDVAWCPDGNGTTRHVTRNDAARHLNGNGATRYANVTRHDVTRSPNGTTRYAARYGSSLPSSLNNCSVMTLHD